MTNTQRERAKPPLCHTSGSSEAAVTAMGAVTTEFWNFLSWSGNSYTRKSSLSSTHLCELFSAGCYFSIQCTRGKERREGVGKGGRRQGWVASREDRKGVTSEGLGLVPHLPSTRRVTWVLNLWDSVGEGGNPLQDGQQRLPCLSQGTEVVGTEGYNGVDSGEQVGTAQDESLQVFFSIGRIYVPTEGWHRRRHRP